jgi:hypothetical protein
MERGKRKKHHCIARIFSVYNIPRDDQTCTYHTTHKGKKKNPSSWISPYAETGTGSGKGKQKTKSRCFSVFSFS